MKGAFTCPHCMTQNACDCEICKPFIKETDYVNKWDKSGNILICGKCGKKYSPDQSLDAEFKLNNMKKKPFIVANVRDILDLYDKEEISFSKMVEMFNDVAEKFYVVPESERNCVNCFYGVTPLGKEPCNSCFGYAKWRME